MSSLSLRKLYPLFWARNATIEPPMSHTVYPMYHAAEVDISLCTKCKILCFSTGGVSQRHQGSGIVIGLALRRLLTLAHHCHPFLPTRYSLFP